MFLVLRCGQNCSILVWPPQRLCDLHLTKTKIYLPKLPSMLNLRSIRPLGAVLQHCLSEEPDFAIPLLYFRVNCLQEVLPLLPKVEEPENEEPSSSRKESKGLDLGECPVS